MVLKRKLRRYIHDDFFIDLYIRNEFPYLDIKAKNMSLGQKLQLLRQYKRGRLEDMSMLDYELFYSSTECYYTYPEYSYFNVFEYDGSIFTSYANVTEDVDLIAYFT